MSTPQTVQTSIILLQELCDDKHQADSTSRQPCHQTKEPNPCTTMPSHHACDQSNLTAVQSRSHPSLHCPWDTRSCSLDSPVPIHLLVSVVPNRHRTIRTPHGNYVGLDLDFLGLIAETIEGTYSILEPHDSGWGTLSSNRTWDGAMGEVVSGRSDVAIGDFTVDYARYQVTDKSG